MLLIKILANHPASGVQFSFLSPLIPFIVFWKIACYLFTYIIDTAKLQMSPCIYFFYKPLAKTTLLHFPVNLFKLLIPIGTGFSRKRWMNIGVYFIKLKFSLQSKLQFQMYCLHFWEKDFLKIICPIFESHGVLIKHIESWNDQLLFCCSVVSRSLWPNGLQHARLPCPSLFPGVASIHVHWVSDAI